MMKGQVVALQQQIESEMRLGATVDDVERDLIEPSGLPKDAKAALWLYAWSYVPVTQQRAELTRIALLTLSG